MKRIISLFLVILFSLPALAENYIYQKSSGIFYACDPSIKRLEIDSSFPDEFIDKVVADYNRVLTAEEVVIKPLSSRDVRNSPRTLRVINFRDEDFSHCNCGGYLSYGNVFNREGNKYYATRPIIVTPPNYSTWNHEFEVHFFGLDHQDNNADFIKLSKKRGLRKNEDFRIQGASSIASYGSRPTQYSLDPLPSDRFIVDQILGKTDDYFVLTANLPEFDGANVMLLSDRVDIPAVVKFNKGTY